MVRGRVIFIVGLRWVEVRRQDMARAIAAPGRKCKRPGASLHPGLVPTVAALRRCGCDGTRPGLGGEIGNPKWQALWQGRADRAEAETA